MTAKPNWASIDTGLFDNPKILRAQQAAGHEATTLYLRGIAVPTRTSRSPSCSSTVNCGSVAPVPHDASAAAGRTLTTMPPPKPVPPADRSWMARARCRAGDPAWWFPEGRVADDDPVWDWPRAWCAGCTVQADCRAWIDAAERGQPKAYLHGTGMWAGETPLQRMARRKKEGTR